jgi:hypothetical protein
VYRLVQNKDTTAKEPQIVIFLGQTNPERENKILDRVQIYMAIKIPDAIDAKLLITADLCKQFPTEIQRLVSSATLAGSIIM